MREVYIEDGEVKMVPKVVCTGVAARWCPIHGNCTHGTKHVTRGTWSGGHCDDRECPLHGDRSTHADDYEFAARFTTY